MKLLCVVLLVLMGHQALTKPRKVKHQRSILNPVPEKNIKVNIGETTGNPESTTENQETTTGKPWVIEPRHGNATRFAERTLLNPRLGQLLKKLKSMPKENVKVRNWHKGCKKDEFRCDSKLCVSEQKRCDGRVNCADGTDEVGCDHLDIAEEVNKRETHQRTNQGCPSGQFRVPPSNRCYKLSTNRMSWSDASSSCSQEGLVFARPSDDDAVAIREYLLNTYGNQYIWVAGRGDGSAQVWADSGRAVSPSLLWPGAEHEGQRDRCLAYCAYEDCVNRNPNRPYTTYYCTDPRKVLCQGCGGEISQSSGTINHPNDGGNYQNLEDCKWTINAGQPIRITFTRFQVETDYDFLTIRDGASSNSDVLGEFTGYSLPHQVETIGNSAFVHFTSDYSVTYSGFELHWAPDGCGEEFTTSNGVITHPSNGGNYENDENCVWKINAEEPIKITFVSFDLEANYDFLYVRNGPDSSSSLLGSFTGSTLPSSVQTTQGSAYLLFSSDYSVTKTGFEIRWEPASNSGSDCECGQVNQASRIVNGIETEVNEYPWQAAMVYSSTSRVFCGASVISARHILTAAHCTQAVTDSGLTYQVLVGAHSLTSPASTQIRLEATRFIQHPNYDSSTVDNDISIIELSSSIDFGSSEIRPVCLPANGDDAYDSVTATVSGWGTLEQGGSQPDVLMEVDVPTISNTLCLESYTDAITDNMLCAGYEEGGKDSCQGDSGGPLIYNSGNSYTQIGVVSWGYDCAAAGYPGVYARVTKYLPWISANAGSSTTCSSENIHTHITEYACEHGADLNIACPAGYVIAVSSANYGRTSNDICNDQGYQYNHIDNCRSETSLQVVTDRCDAKRSCILAASNANFGDPCGNVFKYLEVQYTCEPENNSRISASRGHLTDSVLSNTHAFNHFNNEDQ